VRVAAVKIDGYGDVVGVHLVWYWNSTLEVQNVLLATILGQKLVMSGNEILTMMKQGQDVLHGEV